MMLERGKRSYPEFPWWDTSAVRRGSADYLLCVIPIGEMAQLYGEDKDIFAGFPVYVAHSSVARIVYVYPPPDADYDLVRVA
jgi:hypothetical protein